MRQLNYVSNATSCSLFSFTVLGDYVANYSDDIVRLRERFVHDTMKS